MYKKIFCLMAFSSILNFFMPISMAVDPNCDYYQELVIGQQYFIYNNDYPGYYPASTSCRWIANSPESSKIVISCEDILLPTSSNCQGDRLSISLSGNTNFNDAKNYCGAGSVSLITESNKLAVGLFTSSSSSGGRFVCSLTAIQDEPPTTTAAPSSCDCGWKLGTRIIGGQETGVNEYPSMAALINVQIREVHCGATIIAEKYALTAAHCVQNQNISSIYLLVGDHDVTSASDTNAAAIYQLIQFTVHPSYNKRTLINDIAIVKTLQNIVFHLRVGPVCLPFRYSTFDFIGETVTALGWGVTEYSAATSSPTLQKLDLQVVQNRVCEEKLPNDVITGSQVCAQAPRNKDTCTYDSGGPLLWFETNARRLQHIGIISAGFACALDYPSRNTRVTSYLSWIISSTTDAVYCIK